MGIAEIFAFIRALPEMVKALDRMTSALLQMKQDQIDKELDSIRKDVDIQIQILTTAVNDEQRKKAILDLSRAIGR